MNGGRSRQISTGNGRQSVKAKVRARERDRERERAIASYPGARRTPGYEARVRQCEKLEAALILMMRKWLLS